MNSLGLNLPLNWFDVVVLAVLFVGAMQGRKRGMSQEMIPLAKWVSIVVLCGLVNQQLAGAITEGTVFSKLTSSVTAYIGVAIMVSILFSFVNRGLGGKIVGSDTFGGAEYYLGILAGMVKFSCILIFGLSLLNARLYTQKEIADYAAFVQKNFDNDFFPTLQSVQHAVFKESFSGPVIQENLDFLLIKPVVAEAKPIKRKEFELPM
jgi:uncharacterized membrane protein required for colicin V production